MSVLRLPALALGLSLALAPAAWAQDAAPRPAAEPAKPAASVTGAATPVYAINLALALIALVFTGSEKLRRSIPLEQVERPEDRPIRP